MINKINYDYNIPDYDYNIPECCKNCSNRPKDGEIKMCFCALPSLTTTKYTNIEGKVSNIDYQ